MWTWLRGALRAKVLALACAAAALGPAAAQNGFEFTRMPATMDPPTGWVPAAADVFPDDFTDTFNYHPSNGTVWPCRNQGGRLSCTSNPLLLNYVSGYRLLAADVNEDGRDDLVAYRQNSACVANPPTLMIDVIVVDTTGGGGLPVCREFRARATGWTLFAGDFNADGSDDILGYQSSNGGLFLWAGIPGDGLFADLEVLWAQVSPASGWSFVPGDFDADGRLDLMGYRSADGRFRLCRNVGSRFQCGAVWGAVPAGPKTGWRFLAGRFRVGSARMDIFGFRTGDATLWVGRNSGSSLGFSKWKTLSTNRWTFVSGYFARSVGHGAPQSILGIRTTDGTVHVGRPVTVPAAEVDAASDP